METKKINTVKIKLKSPEECPELRTLIDRHKRYPPNAFSNVQKLNVRFFINHYYLVFLAYFFEKRDILNEQNPGDPSKGIPPKTLLSEWTTFTQGYFNPVELIDRDKNNEVVVTLPSIYPRLDFKDIDPDVNAKMITYEKKSEYLHAIGENFFKSALIDTLDTSDDQAIQHTKKWIEALLKLKELYNIRDNYLDDLQEKLKKYKQEDKHESKEEVKREQTLEEMGFILD